MCVHTHNNVAMYVFRFACMHIRTHVTVPSAAAWLCIM